MIENLLAGVISEEIIIICSKLLFSYIIALSGSLTRHFIVAYKNDEIDLHGPLVLISAIPGIFFGGLALNHFTNPYMGMLVVYVVGMLGMDIESIIRKLGPKGCIKWILKLSKVVQGIANDMEDLEDIEEDKDREGG